ncbi:MAG TPA: hypothetical protein VGJ58_11545 [Gaiellaceae bacterium]
MVTITTRTRKGGRKTHVVRYRLGGRAWPVEHAGSFKTKREARQRRDFVAGELAAGRNPADALRALLEMPPTRSGREWANAYKTSRVDLADREKLNPHLERFNATFGDRDLAAVVPSDVQEWVAANTKTPENEKGLEPSSLVRYMATTRLTFDFAGIKPNAARDDRVKLPTILHEEPQPPSAAHFLALLDRSPKTSGCR